MKHAWRQAIIVGFTFSTPAMAGSTEEMLMKLDPEFRAHQACIIRGLDIVGRDPALRGADRIKTSIFSHAVVTETTLNAPGGAVKVKHRWFALSFSCDLTPDHLKAKSFTYKLGSEIPGRQWEQLGLWD